MEAIKIIKLDSNDQNILSSALGLIDRIAIASERSMEEVFDALLRITELRDRNLYIFNEDYINIDDIY